MWKAKFYRSASRGASLKADRFFRHRRALAGCGRTNIGALAISGAAGSASAHVTRQSLYFRILFRERRCFSIFSQKICQILPVLPLLLFVLFL